MQIGNLNVSRPVLALELAVCFAPVTLGWLDVVAGQSGVVRLDADTVRSYFLGYPGGGIALATIAAEAVLGIVGPIGLLLGIGAVALGRPLTNRALGNALSTAAALIGAVLVANKLLLGSILTAADLIGAIVLFSLLPLVGVRHLLHLGGHRGAGELALRSA